MNADDTNTIYNIAVETYAFAQSHFSYYAGVIVGMLTDSNKNKDFKSWLNITLINIVIVTASIEVLKDYGFSKGAIVLVCCCLAFFGYPAIKQFSEQKLPLIVDLLGDSALRIGKAITDRIIDWVGKK